MSTEHEINTSTKIDREKWNQIIFENANKYHLHQDNLRWSLSAGFAAFFYGGITVMNNPNISVNNIFVHYLQLSLTVIGTAYLFLLMMEGWYYNLILAYLVNCEEKLAAGDNLVLLSQFDRNSVPSFHPSFACVLFLASIVNSFHLFEFVQTEYGSYPAGACALAYVCASLSFALFGKVPRRVDATLNRAERRMNRKRA